MFEENAFEKRDIDERPVKIVELQYEYFECIWIFKIGFSSRIFPLC